VGDVTLIPYAQCNCKPVYQFVDGVNSWTGNRAGSSRIGTGTRRLCGSHVEQVDQLVSQLVPQLAQIGRFLLLLLLYLSAHKQHACGSTCHAL